MAWIPSQLRPTTTYPAPDIPIFRPPPVIPPNELLASHTGFRKSRRILKKDVPAVEFLFFPLLPRELRVRIWAEAYSTIHIPDLLRFRLEFINMPLEVPKYFHVHSKEDEVLSNISVTGRSWHQFSIVDYRFGSSERGKHQDLGPRKKMALLQPLPEVAIFTRDLRRLRAVNAEARMESEFSPINGGSASQDTRVDSHLEFLGRIYGCGDRVCPIRLPWSRRFTQLCLVDLTAADADLLFDTSTVTTTIDDIFAKVQKFGLMLNRRHSHGFERKLLWPKIGHHGLADLIKRFHSLEWILLVSDLLMSEDTLLGMDDHDRERYMFDSWYDWAGRIPETWVEDARYRTGNVRMKSLEQHVYCMDRFHRWLDVQSTWDARFDIHTNTSGFFPMMKFRTIESCDFILTSDEEQEELMAELTSDSDSDSSDEQSSTSSSNVD